jgi:hypothetical protein
VHYVPSLRNKAEELYDVVASGKPAAISLPVFKDTLKAKYHNWNNRLAEATGRIFDPPAGAVATLGHAVSVVAFEPDPTAKGGGIFIFRNSWGTSWAKNGATGPSGRAGYGYVSAGYVHDHGWELLHLV